MTTEELLAECRAARPEMDWTAYGSVVEGKRFGFYVSVCLVQDLVHASLPLPIGGANGSTVAEALAGLAKLVEEDCAAAEERVKMALKMLAALAAPLPLDRCAACGFMLKDGCQPGDCGFVDWPNGPHNPIEPKRYAKEKGV